jgi:hypothetical protein
MVREIRLKNAPDVRIVLNQEDAADPVIWRAKMALSAAHSWGIDMWPTRLRSHS